MEVSENLDGFFFFFFFLGVKSLTQCQLRKQSKQKTHRGGGFVVLGGQTSVILLF